MLLSATRIHDGQRFLAPGAALEVSADGAILAVHDQVGQADRFFDGILCPGFVNAHCHLELSHLRGCFAPGQGLISFLKQVPFLRGRYSEEDKRKARLAASEEMLRNGIVAVGDIANTGDTADIRAAGSLHIHTFVEALGFTETHAASRFEAALAVYRSLQMPESGSRIVSQSITPHAPYSVSPSLFRLIDEALPGSIVSIHNQESRAEDEFYRTGSGAVRELLTHLGIDDNFFRPSGSSSLQTYGNWISPEHPLILVHNTFSAPEDIEWAVNRFPKLYWCLCPNANLFLEGALPDIAMLRQAGATICLGTDSLASNNELSILSEILVLKERCSLDWELLLCWATRNGALALGMEAVAGSFCAGMSPGILHISEPEGRAAVTRVL